MSAAPLPLDRIVERYPFLADLPPDLAARLRVETSLVRVPAGAQLFGERDACQAFPLVLSGRIRVAKSAAGGRQLKLYEVTPGDSCILSTSCLLSQQAYPADGRTESDVELVVVPAGLFMDLVDRFAPLRKHVFSLFAERLAELMALVEAVAFQKLDQRIATRLLGHGPRVRLTHQQLADELGSAREIVSRVLGQMADEGLVRGSRQEIEILDATRLRERAQR